MSKYRYGTYFKGKLTDDNKIVIDANTDEKEIEAFLKDCGANMKRRILEGNSELSYKIAAEQKAKREKLKTAQQEQEERVAKLVDEKVSQATSKSVEAKPKRAAKKGK